MTILYLDCYAGISGDMTVAALLDLGAPLEHLRSELRRLALPDGAYEVAVERVERHGLSALRFDVTPRDCHPHRSYSVIDAMIAGSGLGGSVKERARRVFRRLAEAESGVHGVGVEEVEFHEVGAIDSIVDIVGTAICLEYLGVGRIFAAPLPLGSGFVATSHGRLPVPAPATTELLRGLAVHGQCGAGERVTPTGAAIVAALAEVPGERPAMTVTGIGSGAGSMDFGDCPNILRAFLGREEGGVDPCDEIVVVETNIDDSTPEVLGYAMERLLAEGALDVFFTPIQMKKNRPATLLSFLCQPSRLDALSRLALMETSAIGLRYHRAGRIKLERCIRVVQTEFGPVRFKLLFERGRFLRASPEYEECRRIAAERGAPCQEVMRRLAALDLTGESPS